jgi:hypothetical protein
MKAEVSSPCSQQSAAGLYPGPVESSPYPSILFILILISYLSLCIQICLFLSGVNTKSVFPMRTTCFVHLLLYDVMNVIIFGGEWGLHIMKYLITVRLRLPPS